MAKFQSLKYKRDLKNAQHFAFIQAFITALTAAGFTAAKIVSKLAELVTAFGVEDRYYMIVRASEIIAQRTAADEQRDRYYTRLHRLIQAWAGSGMAQLDAAATALEKVFNLYKVKVNAQMDEETGVLENLITDLSTTAMQAHLATINGTYLFQQMVEGQTLVKSLRLEQGVEESEKVYGALSAARKECDRLYDEMTDLLESFAKVADDATAYETFISHWNGTVKIYQDMLDRKQGSGSGSGDGDDKPTPTPNPTPDPNNGGGSSSEQGSGSSEQGSGSTEQGGSSSEQGSGSSEQGGSNEQGGGSGDNGSGSGDNGGGSDDNGGGGGPNGGGNDVN
jgi:hypothetical protein